MGAYNCQECMTKEINFLNELLLNGDILGKNEMNNNKLVSPSRVNIKASKDNLIKALDKANLSPQEKQYYKNFINEHPNTVINLGQNNNIINGNDSYEPNNEIKNIEEDEYLVEQDENQAVGQNNFYQMDQQQMLEQESLMEEYKNQQLLNKLKAEEEELKKQIEKAQNEERMFEESNHFQESKIKTLEPQNIVVNKDKEQQIISKNTPNQNSNEREIQQKENDSIKLRNKIKKSKNNNRKRNINRNNNKEISNKNTINTNTQTNKTEILKQERIIRNVFNIEEQKSQNQPIVLRTKEQYIKQIDNENKINENENFIFSQKFNTETYEPEEEKNDYLDDHENYNNNNEKNNNNDDDDDVGPKDNRKKGSITERGNNSTNYKINILKNSPKDNRGSFKVNKNMESDDGIGPRDSRRKDDINNKFNGYYPKMNLKIKSPIKPAMYQEMPYNNYKSKDQYNNAANPKSLQQQYDFIKREALSSSSSQRNFKNNKQKLSPLFNQNQNEQIYQ